MGKAVFLLPLVSAVVLSAAYPPFDLGILAWIGISPFLYALRRATSAGAAGMGLIFGLVFVTGIFYWAPRVNEISWFGFLLCLIAFSLYFVLFGFFYRLISRTAGSWILIGAPVLWVFLEYVRANLFFLAWPWNLLGHSQYRYLTVIQISDITGVYGISFLIVLVNQILSRLPDFAALQKKKHGKLCGRQNRLIFQSLVVALVMVPVFLYGLYRINSTVAGKKVRVALVQTNRIVTENMKASDQVEHLNAYDRLSRIAGIENPDLIVWPAASLPAAIRSSRLVRHTVTRLAQQTDSYLMAGGAGLEKMKPKKEGYKAYSNSEFLIDPSGHLKGEYNKMKLVPFNEYLPLQGWIPWPGWLTSLKESFTPGDQFLLFDINGVKSGAPICWENMFPDVFRRFVKDGAHFMVSATNEAFLGRTAGPHQTLAMAAFRAVENRVAIARSAPTGVSAFINPDGEIVERVRDKNANDLFVEGYIVRDIPVSDKKTFYTLYGDIFAYCCIGLALLFIMYSWLPEKRRPAHPENLI
jgi:apolipoprotein N-acyltransferase